MNTTLELRYGLILVGEIADPFLHQNTWFGSFRQRVSQECGSTEQRLCEFISFCNDWDARNNRGDDADASEFEQFDDVLNSGLWYTRTNDGAVSRIDQAPFFSGDEISWQTPESPDAEPSASD
jgi:hypothetical protein